MRALLPLIASASLLAGCGNDGGLRTLCVETDTAFDIEEASVLQDAPGHAGIHDAVILEQDTSSLPDDAVWRVRSVDVLAMLPRSTFDEDHEGLEIKVEIWDHDDPESGSPWSLVQEFERDDLEWTDVDLENPTEAIELSWRRAWWSFDFGDIVPESGMNSDRYIVGVEWPDANIFLGEEVLPLGYSNYNRSCARNWTWRANTGWNLNSDTSGDVDECSWPMLRVHREVIAETDDCEGRSVAID